MNKYLILFALLASASVERVYGMDAIQSLNSADLVGRYTDELPKSSDIGRFTQPLVGNPNLALEYRIEGRQEYVMLLEGQEDSRWKIVDSLKMPMHSKKESVSFSCSVAGGSPPEAGAGSLGIVRQVKKAQIVTATHGWSVNVKSKKLEPVRDKKIVCDLHGVD